MFFLYDTDCGFCKDWIKYMKNFNYSIDIKFIPCQEYNHDFERELNCKDSSYFIYETESGKKIYDGASGVNYLLRRITNNRLLKYFGYLYLIPPINFLEDLGYFIIKNNRSNLRKVFK